jgi:hypothetical protein
MKGVTNSQYIWKGITSMLTNSQLKGGMESLQRQHGAPYIEDIHYKWNLLTT